jgi:acetoin utilization deacetylase AcuC-like enzyme
MLKIAYSPKYKLELPDGHIFPITKFELLHNQLLLEGIVQKDNFFQPNLVAEDVILQTHTPQYWDALKHKKLTEKEILKLGFPLSTELIEANLLIAGGAIQCTQFAQQYGVAFSIAGGSHHAFSDHGEAFSLLNDVAIAANYLINNKLYKRILIIDLDVHQGNGTAKIFKESPNGWFNDPEKKGGVFTFSMHAEKNYPKRKEQSNLDIALPDNTDDISYLTILKDNLTKLFDTVQPDFVFFNAGIDLIKGDKLGRLAVTKEGCKLRDKMVFEKCKKNNVPVVVLMGGGHLDRLSNTIDAYINTYRVAKDVFFEQ